MNIIDADIRPITEVGLRKPFHVDFKAVLIQLTHCLIAALNTKEYNSQAGVLFKLGLH